MEYNHAPRGLVVDLITPLTNGAIDKQGLGRLLRRVSPHAKGVLLASPEHGEGEKLALELRFQLLETALDTLGDRSVALYVWITGEGEKETREGIRAFQERFNEYRPKGGLFWVDTPLSYHSNRGLPDHYRELLSETGIPLILHNDPDCIHTKKAFKRHNIRTAVLKELVLIDGITGLIFSGSLERAHHYQRACRTRQRFRIYDGSEKRFLEYPSMAGVVSVGANLAPGAWEKITESSIGLHAHREDYPDRLQQIWELGDYLKTMASLYARTPRAIIKRVLWEMGVIETSETLAPGAVAETSLESLKNIMRDFKDFA